MADDAWYFLIQWEDRFVSVIEPNQIVEPEKNILAYKEGELIVARFGKKNYEAVICEIHPNKKYLEKRVKLPPKFKFDDVKGELENHDEKTAGTCDKSRLDEAVDVQNRKRKTAKSVKTDESEKRKERDLERDLNMQQVYARILQSQEQEPLADRVNRLETKSQAIPGHAALPDSEMNKSPTVPDVTTQTIRPSNNILSPTKSFTPDECKSPKPAAAAASEIIIDDADTNESGCVLDENFDFLGDPNYEIKVRKDKKLSIINTAKTPEKLALGLLELILTKEEVHHVTIYGNKQHNKAPLCENKRKALKAEVFRKFPDPDTNGHQWDNIVVSLNDKIRNFRKGKYDINRLID